MNSCPVIGQIENYLIIHLEVHIMGKYVNNNLSSGETIVCEASFSKKVAVMHFVLCGVCLLIGLIGIGMAAGGNTALVLFLAVGGFILSPVFFVLGLSIIITNATSELAVTSKRIIGKVAGKSMDAPLDKIQTVIVSQGLLGGIVGEGTVQINTAFGLYHYKHVDNPEAFKRKVMEQIESYKDEKIHKEAEAIVNRMNK